MNTTNQIKEAIGQERPLRIGGHGNMVVRVRVLDARINYGRLEYLVEPVGGSGQGWRSADNCRLPSETNQP